jgi:hypothetical protein
MDRDSMTTIATDLLSHNFEVKNYTQYDKHQVLFTILIMTPFHPPPPKWYNTIKNFLETWESLAEGGVILRAKDPLKLCLKLIKANAKALIQSINCVILYIVILIVSMPCGLPSLL